LEDEDEVTVKQRLEEAAARHARHYCEVLAAANELYLKGDENVVAGLALYDLEQRNIAAGQDWAVKRMEISDEAARLAANYAGAGVNVLDLRLQPHARFGWFQAQLNACRKLRDRKGEGQALGGLGNVYRNLRERSRAIEHYERSLEIAQEVGDRQGEGRALGGLGNVYRNLRDGGRAIEHYQRSLKIAQELGDRRGEGRTIGNLGAAYLSLREPRFAIEQYERSLALVRELGDQRGEGNALFDSALAFDQLGERVEAIRRMEAALRIYEQIQSPWREKARAQLAEWRERGRQLRRRVGVKP
jgi:tetratricopeptide (TPR) repeat protein